MQFLLAVVQPPLVRRIDDPDESVRGLEVVSPVAAETLLSAHVPDVEVEPVVLQSLDVEPEGRGDRVHVLAVELLQHGRLAGVVQAAKNQLHTVEFRFKLTMGQQSNDRYNEILMYHLKLVFVSSKMIPKTENRELTVSLFLCACVSGAHCKKREFHSRK